MEFVQPLETFIATPNFGFVFYRKKVTCVRDEAEKGELLGISSNGTVTFNFGAEDVAYHIKSIKDIELIDQESAYHDVDDDAKSVIIKQPGISIKDKVDDIAKYKIVQHLIYTLFKNNYASSIEPLKIENRKQYLNARSAPAKKVEISQNITNMKQIEMNNDLQTGFTFWLNESPEKETPFTQNDLLSLLNSYRTLWANYVLTHHKHKSDHDQDTKMDENEEKTEQKTYSTYLEWDNWSIKGTAPKSDSKTADDPKAEDIYLKSLWPHCFQGPYFKTLNSSANREWKCKKCNKSAAAKVVEWYKDGVISTRCNICGNNCDASCALARGEDLQNCGIARSNGTCNKCEHKVVDHQHVGWKCREVAKDNNVMEQGRIKYYKTKRTVLTFEVCHSCIKAAKNKQEKVEKQQSTKLKERRKKKRKNGEEPKSKNVISPQDKAPKMDFKNIVIPTSSGFKSKSKPKPKPKPMAEKPVERIALTQDMRDNTSVRTALCIIPPKELWPNIQAIRKIHDPAYIRWMPHLNIFFPFIDEKHFDTIGKYIEQEIVVRNKIKSFNVGLNKFDVFERIRNKLGSFSHSTKVETMFLDPSWSDDVFKREMQGLFDCLRGDWPTCANKHGGGFSPHLTVGKFKMKEMLDYQRKFQKDWKNISWKCDALCLISRRGNDPFVIRRKIPLC